MAWNPLKTHQQKKAEENKRVAKKEAAAGQITAEQEAAVIAKSNKQLAESKTARRKGLQTTAKVAGTAVGAYYLAGPAWNAIKGVASGTGGVSKLAGLAKSAGGWTSLLKGLGLAGGAYGAGRGVQEARDYAEEPLSGADQASQGTMQDLQSRLLQELGGSDVSPAVAEMYSAQEPRIAGTMWDRGLIGSSAHGVALSDLAKRSYLAGEQIRQGRQGQSLNQLDYLGGQLGKFRGQENAARQQYIQGLSGLGQLGAGVYNYASGLPEQPQLGPSTSQLRSAGGGAGAPALPPRFSQPPPYLNSLSGGIPTPGQPQAAGLRFLPPPPTSYTEDPIAY